MSRDELIRLLGIAAHGPTMPWPSDEQRPGDGRMRPPTPDEWAAHVVECAKALGRAVDKEEADLAADEERRQKAVHDRGVEILQRAHEERQRRAGEYVSDGPDAVMSAVVGIATECMVPLKSELPTAVTMALPCGGVLIGVDPRLTPEGPREDPTKEDEATGEERYASATIDADALYEEERWASAVSRDPGYIVHLIDLAAKRLERAEAEAARCHHRIIYFESVRMEQERRIAVGESLGEEM